MLTAELLKVFLAVGVWGFFSSSLPQAASCTGEQVSIVGQFWEKDRQNTPASATLQRKFGRSMRLNKHDLFPLQREGEASWHQLTLRYQAQRACSRPVFWLFACSINPGMQTTVGLDTLEYTDLGQNKCMEMCLFIYGYRQHGIIWMKEESERIWLNIWFPVISFSAHDS